MHAKGEKNVYFNLVFIYSGARVKRFHTASTLQQQTIAEHSFGVAWLCEWLTGGKASKDLILAALSHDLAEQLTGDIPSPAKRSLGIQEVVGHREATILQNNNIDYESRLTGTELRVLKLADALDGMVFCVHEHTLGNKAMRQIFNRFKTYVKEAVTEEHKDKVLLLLTNFDKYMED